MNLVTDDVIKLIASLTLTLFVGPETARSSDGIHDALVKESRSQAAKTDRVSVLGELRTADAGAGIWWHSGFLRINQEWMSYERAVSELAKSDTTLEYRRKREQAATATHHLRLGLWCKANRMPSRHRVHTSEAIRLDPSLARHHSPKDLGLVSYLGVWVWPETASELQREVDYQRRCFKRWNPVCQRIARNLDGNAAQVIKAKKLLSEIESPDAVPVIDFIIGRRHKAGAFHAINALRRIDCVRSSRVLASYAVFSPVQSVRDAAIAALTTRRLSDFVPQLLELLATEIVEANHPTRPLRIMQNPWSIPDFVFRQTFMQESRNRVTVKKSVLRMQPITNQVAGVLVANQSNVGAVDNFNAGQRRQAEIQAARIANQAQYERSRAADQINTDTRAQNERVMTVLAATTEADFETPQQWWMSWDDHVGVEPPPKPVIEVEEVEIREMESQFIRVLPMTNGGCSCFAQGTLVRTEQGPKPIESIRMGDRVLSQNIETGEIQFCVVEKPTIRPQPGPVLELQIGDEKIVCTPGHEIWKNGSGWVRAKELTRGDRVHTLTGSVAVLQAKAVEDRITYNLVVENNHNYFVGNSAFLVQDITTAFPTDNAVPGLSRFELKD